MRNYHLATILPPKERYLCQRVSLLKKSLMEVVFFFKCDGKSRSGLVLILFYLVFFFLSDSGVFWGCWMIYIGFMMFFICFCGKN